MSSIHYTIFSLFEKRGFRPAYRLQKESGGYRSLSCEEVREKSLRLSAYLRSRGVEAGDRVMLVSENGPEWPIAAMAILNLKAILVPVASIGSNIEIENTLKSARPKFCIYSKDIASARHLDGLVKAENVNSLCWRLQQDQPLEEWISDQSPLEVDSTARATDIAVLIYTSGTTGTPKGVPISHGNILANARSVISVIEVSERDRVVSVLPLSHMLEFTGGFVLTALVGAAVTYIKGLKPEELLRAMKDSKATVLIGVPLLFEVIARNLNSKLSALPAPLPWLFASFAKCTKKYPFLGKLFFYPVHSALGGNVRFLVAGGSKLHPQTFDYFKGLGITLLQGYGLTESSPVLTFTSMKNAAPDHVGNPVPGVEIGIFDENGKLMAKHQEGEIWAKGANIFSGYLDAGDSVGVFQDGWFKTGDLGNLDESGLLRITGRKKDVIVTSAGKNVYPEEIEGIVLATDLYLEAAAFGMIDGAGHEKITLVLVPDKAKFPGKSLEEIKIEAATNASNAARILADYKWPQKIEVLFEDLPRTSTRKVKKHELRKYLEGRERAKHIKASADQSEPGGTGLNLANNIEGAIARGIADISQIDPAKIRLSDSLVKDLGLDSLTFVELVGSLEKKNSIRIEGVEFANIVTVNDLVSVFQIASISNQKPRVLGKVFFTEFEPIANKKILWRFPRTLFNSFVRLTLHLRHDVEVFGIEHLNDGGPFVFTPNHSSHFDLLTIAGSIPLKMIHRTYAVAAKDYFFNGTLKSLCARIFVNAIPFDRKGRVNESMQRCREALDSGGSLVIFPEGTRSPNGLLQDFKQGVGQLLAGNAAARAVPVYIDGAYHIMPKGSKFPRSGKLRVTFGKPISFRDLTKDPVGFKKVADRLRAEVVDLGRGRIH